MQKTEGRDYGRPFWRPATSVVLGSFIDVHLVLSVKSHVNLGDIL